MVEDAALGIDSANQIHEFKWQHLASKHQDPCGNQIRLHSISKECSEVRRSDLHAIDAIASAVRSKAISIAGCILAQNVKRAAAQQRREQNCIAKIRGKGGNEGVGGAFRNL